MTRAARRPIPEVAAGDGVPAAALDAAALAHVREVVARSGTSFLWGMRVLPRRRRQAMYAVYAFCRAVDDVADEPGEPAAKLAQLAAWRGEVERLYAGAPTRPITQALRAPVAAFALPKEEFLAIIDGMEMDVRDALVTPTTADFALYCRRVAGAVGLLSIRVFGDTGPAARELALVLGEALQTTNILRDLAEDAARGRLYLPGDLLERHGIAARDPAVVLADPRLPAVCVELAGHARERFAEARALIARCDRRRLRPARLMLEAYGRLLDRLEARGWARPEVAVRLSRLEKTWIALRYSLF